MLNLSLLFLVLSLTDYNFRQIITKPDNVPIVLLIYSVGFITWLGTSSRPSSTTSAWPGRAVLGKAEEDKVLVWPDLVYTELICMVVSDLRPGVWAVVSAGPAGRARLVRARRPTRRRPRGTSSACRKCWSTYDPWMAGVVLPEPDHRGPDGHSLHRFQQEGERLLLLQGAVASPS